MNWTTFIKDNSQALFTLIGVFLGAAITFLGNYLNNKFQAKENDKNRQEKRKEAKPLLAIELMKTDLKHIDDLNNLIFEILNRIKILYLKRNRGLISQEELFVELRSMLTSVNGLVEEMSKLATKSEVLLYIRGDEIYSTYKDCEKVFKEYLDVLGNQSATEDDQDKVSDNLIKNYGKLQKMLRDELISISDS